jgi:hypothetical protein
MSTSKNRIVTASAFTVAAVGFLAFPVLRPYGDEQTLPGVEGIASPAWVFAHTMGMLGFLALTVAVWTLRSARLPSGDRAAGVAGVLVWLGTSLVLPFYGGETFALHVIARRAVAEGDAGLIELVDGFRTQPVAITLFGAGLLVLAAAGVFLAVSLWRSGGLARTAGALVGLALLLYLPQYYFPAAGRIGHGVLLATGCLLLAAAVLRHRPVVAARTPAVEHGSGNGSGSAGLR